MNLHTVRRVVFPVAITAAIAIGSGCGGDDGGAADPEESALIDALESAFLAEAAEMPPGTEITPDAARCMADTVMEVAGMDLLEEAGITPELVTARGTDALEDILDPDSLVDGEAMVSGVLRCLDMQQFFAAQMMASGGSPESAECIAAAVVDLEGFEEWAAASVLSGLVSGEQIPPPAGMEDAISEVWEECLTPEERSRLGI